MPNELDIVQDLIKAKKYKEASVEATKYLNDAELGNAFAIILAESLRKAEMYNALVECYEIIWKEKRLVLGNWDTRHYANALRKCRKYEEALIVCSELKMAQPNFKPILGEYYWNIYYVLVKQMEISQVQEEEIIPLAKEIKECFENDDNKKFTPYCLTILYVSEFFHHKKEFDKCSEWISYLNPIDLGKEGKFKKGDEIIVYDPHRAKYYRFYTDALIAQSKNDEAKKVVIAALNDYPFWLNMSEKLLILANKEFKVKGRPVFEKLLSTIGFSDDQVKQRYLNALLGKNQEFAQNWENNFHELPDYTRNFQVLMLGKVLKRLFNEVVIKNKQMTELPNPNYENASASELGDFVFCPASYALQKTMVVQKDAETDLELSWAEKKLLIDRFEIYKTDLGTKSSFSQEEIERIGEFPKEFEFIFQSKILQESKKNKKPKIFFNQETKFSGVPDYWLENNIKYVVEEKFTRYSDKKEDTQIEFPNHRAEVLGQIIELKELKAQKGFVIYWLWNFEKVQYGSKISTDYRLKGVRIFPIELTQQNIDFYNKKINEIKSFNANKILDFDSNNLIANKCINCSVTQFCHHKTGKIHKLKLPYNDN